jgi:ankyrin repeat protein
LLAKLLLEHGVNPDIPEGKDKEGQREAPLHTAVIKGNLELLQFLVRQGASLNVQDKDGQQPRKFSNLNFFNIFFF